MNKQRLKIALGILLQLGAILIVALVNLDGRSVWHDVSVPNGLAIMPAGIMFLAGGCMALPGVLFPASFVIVSMATALFCAVAAGVTIAGIPLYQAWRLATTPEGLLVNVGLVFWGMVNLFSLVASPSAEEPPGPVQAAEFVDGAGI
jgi:hypothetical protein